MKTHKKIKKIRLLLCMSQKEFAEAIGVTPSVISFYENGKREPSIATIRKILAVAKEKQIPLSLEDIRDLS